MIKLRILFLAILTLCAHTACEQGDVQNPSSRDSSFGNHDQGNHKPSSHDPSNHNQDNHDPSNHNPNDGSGGHPKSQIRSVTLPFFADDALINTDEDTMKDFCKEVNERLKARNRTDLELKIRIIPYFPAGPNDHIVINSDEKIALYLGRASTDRIEHLKTDRNSIQDKIKPVPLKTIVLRSVHSGFRLRSTDLEYPWFFAINQMNQKLFTWHESISNQENLDKFIDDMTAEKIFPQ